MYLFEKQTFTTFCTYNNKIDTVHDPLTWVQAIPTFRLGSFAVFTVEDHLQSIWGIICGTVQL